MKHSDPSILELCAVEFTYSRFIHTFSLYLLSKGWTVSASFNCSPSTIQFSRESFLPVILYPSVYFRSVRPRHLLKTWFSLIRTLSCVQTSLVHVHTPLISYLVRFQFYFPWLRSSRKLIYTVHGFYFHSNGPFFSNLLHIILELLLLPSCDLVFFVSKADFKLASPYLQFLGIPHVYSGNGISTSTFIPSTLRSRECLSPYCSSSFDCYSNSFIIGFVGRLVPEKGLLELFEAFVLFHQMYPDSVLLLVGDRLPSDYDTSIALLFDSLSQELPFSVITTGMIDDIDTMSKLYQSMDIFCLPSHREGLPMSLIEAMSCGIPSIASDIRGCNQLIDHKKNGLLVPTHSSSELFSAMCQLRSQPDLMSFISKNARSLVVSDYDIDQCLDVQFDNISLL